MLTPTPPRNKLLKAIATVTATTLSLLFITVLLLNNSKVFASGVQALARLFVGTTPITGGSNGDCLTISTGILGSQGCGGSPSGAAGGGLTGSYPNPTVATVPASALPAPSATTLGGVKSLAAIAHQFLTSITTAGAPTQAQPVCADLSNAAASCSTDATVASNITSGLIPNARLPVFASLTAQTGNISNTETVVTSLTAPANLFVAGAMIRISTQGNCTSSISSGSWLYRIRIGPTTLTGTSLGIASPVYLVSQTGKHFDLEGYITIRSVVTTTATVDSETTNITDPTLLALGASSFGGSGNNTFNPTIQNLVELTFQSPNAGSSCSFFMALLEQVI